MKLNKIASALAVSALALGATAAHAVIDVAPAATAITTDGSAAMTVIGTAMVTISVVALVFKWAKAAIFG